MGRDREADRALILSNRRFLVQLYTGTKTENETIIAGASHSQIYALMVVMNGLATGDIPFVKVKYLVLSRRFKKSIRNLRRYYKKLELASESLTSEKVMEEQQERLLSFAACFRYLLGALFNEDD